MHAHTHTCLSSLFPLPLLLSIVEISYVERTRAHTHTRHKNTTILLPSPPLSSPRHTLPYTQPEQNVESTGYFFFVFFLTLTLSVLNKNADEGGLLAQGLFSSFTAFLLVRQQPIFFFSLLFPFFPLTPLVLTFPSLIPTCIAPQDG